MAFNIATAESSYELAPAGSHAGWLIQIIDLGFHENSFKPGAYQRKVRLVFELADEKTTKGEAFLLARDYTLSLFELASFRQLLEGWRGRAFETAELDGFQLEKLLGATGLLSIIHTKSKAGKDYAKLISIAKLPKNLTVGEPVSEKFIFDTENPDMVKHLDLPEWLKKKINLVHPLALESGTLTQGSADLEDVPF